MENLKKIATNSFIGFFIIGYFVMGIVQAWAICSFFMNYLGWHLVPSFIVALLTGHMPLVGSVLGVIAANKYWGWSITGSVLLFFWPFILSAIMLLIAGITYFIDKQFSVGK